MSDLPAPSSPASLSPEILTPCPTPLFPSAFSRLSQPRTVAKQLEEAAVGELPPNPTIENLPKVVWKNRRFVQEALLARKGAKGRKSWIRSHGMFFIELNHQDQPIGHVWCCSRYDKKGRLEFFSDSHTRVPNPRRRCVWRFLSRPLSRGHARPTAICPIAIRARHQTLPMES